MKNQSDRIIPCFLTACATEPVTAYRWHRSGASEAEVSRKINTCKSPEVQNGNYIQDV